MSKHHARASVIVGAILVSTLAACGGDGGSTGPSYSDSASVAEVQAFAGNAIGYAKQVASDMNFQGPVMNIPAPATAFALVVGRYASVAENASALRRLGSAGPAAPDPIQAIRALAASAPQGCTTISHGTLDPLGGTIVDANQNGIADDYLMRVDCRLVDSAGGDTLVTQTTVYEVSLREVAGSLFGFEMRYLLEQGESDNFGHYVRSRLELRQSRDTRPSRVTDAYRYGQAVQVAQPGTTAEVLTTSAWDASFSPVTPIALGTALPNGSFTLQGTYSVAGTGMHNLSFTTTTTTPLAYSAACAAAGSVAPFSAGSLRGRLNNDPGLANFTVNYLSCTNVDVTTQASTVAGPAPRAP